jgi:predicted DNA repair protein MutK
MFLVGGGILLHGVPAWHHAIEESFHGLADYAALGMLVANGLTGLFAGCLALATIQAGRALLVRAG